MLLPFRASQQNPTRRWFRQRNRWIVRTNLHVIFKNLHLFRICSNPSRFFGQAWNRCTTIDMKKKVSQKKTHKICRPSPTEKMDGEYLYLGALWCHRDFFCWHFKLPGWVWVLVDPGDPELCAHLLERPGRWENPNQLQLRATCKCHEKWENGYVLFITFRTSWIWNTPPYWAPTFINRFW